MKTLSGLILSAALCGALGCTTTEKDKYMADHPPPLANRDRAPTAIDPVKQTTRTPLTAAEINDTNVQQSYSRLESELKADGKSSANAGR